MARELPKYRITLSTRDKKKADPPSVTIKSLDDTQIRRAIRRANKLLLVSARRRPQVTVHGWQPGDDTSKRGRIEYQAHRNRAGKIIVEER